MEIVGQTPAPALPLRTAIESGSLAGPVFAETLHYYDGSAFAGLALGAVGAQGARTRTEELTLSDAQVKLLGNPPYLDPTGPPAWTADYPPEFRTLLPALAGYVFRPASSEITGGYYSKTRLTAFDFQLGTGGRGLPLRQRDPLDHESSILYDAYSLLAHIVTDPVGNQTQATYDYRTLQPATHTDANHNVSQYSYTPLGLLETVVLMGKPGESVGDTPAEPRIRYEYQLSPFSSTGQPISIHTVRRVHHVHDPDLPSAERDDTIEMYEYSDGLGRVVQTRALAEDVVFDDAQYGDAGLPVDQALKGNSPVGRARGPSSAVNVVVSGWQIYDNKGRVIEKYEPFFSTEWAYEPLAIRGVKAEFYYDARGQLLRSIAPDRSERLIVNGVPADLGDPGSFVPTAWESYTYDANDNAGRTHATTTGGYKSHWNTPTSTVIDALGRKITTTDRNGPSASDWYTTKHGYDIRGNLLSAIDTYGRTMFAYAYDCANRAIRTVSLDGGSSILVNDALGEPVEQSDAKGATVLHAHDAALRPIRLWARDKTGDAVTLRQRLVYGEALPNAAADNLRGRLHQHFDEAGLLTITAYDFKGNLTEKHRQLIGDDEMAAIIPQQPSDPAFYQVDWSATPPPALESTAFATSIRYDALNRVFDTHFPRDVTGQRRTLHPSYNRAGALESIRVDGRVYVDRIAYNARGQRSLIAYGNGTITRYAHDPQTFRLKRTRSERCSKPNPVTYQLTGQPLQDFAYDHDLVGNILALQDRTPQCGLPSAPDVLDRGFTYDPIYRLLSATGRECNTPSGTNPWDDAIRCETVAATRPYSESYQYDDVGNLQSLTHLGGPSGSFTRLMALVTNTNKLKIITVGGNSFPYAYDAAGNVTRESGSRRLHWDFGNRLRAFAEQADNAAPTLQAQYLYDAGGQRAKKLVRTAPSRWDVTIYLDGGFEHHREYRPGGVRENDEVHVADGDSLIANLRTGPALSGDPFPNLPNGVLYYLGDHLQSTNVALDDAGASLNREEYTPYGETSFGSFAHKRFRFTGKERDEESGLNYHGARYLSPWLGRWISCDPAGLVDGPNVFSYAGNNPLTFHDPSGRQKEAPRLAGDYIDAFKTATYDIDYRSENHQLSKYVQLHFGDGRTVDVNVDTIGNRTMSTMDLIHAIDDHVLPSGIIAPSELNRTTTPRLWNAKQAVLGIQDNFNTLMIIQAFASAVFMFLGMGAGVAGGGGSPKSRLPPTVPARAAEPEAPLVTPGKEIVKYDPIFAGRQILGHDPVTPGGRDITPHAADRMVNPPRGRSPMTAAEVDQVLDTGTKIKVKPHPEGDTITVQHPNMPGKPQVAVDAATGKRVITVIKGKVK